MMIETDNMVAMTEANQNFSKVVRIVDENGMAVILRNNKPRYILVDFDEYDDIQRIKREREEKIEEATNSLIEKNMEALLELAK